ncbi:PREDICTED: biogenesis of lysosome-related organelles complex 1 subunit 4-like [Nanorana parkeri]|uniref:biogenesis of lysosome-related organelles complex 1 subunit 4-like n=1 Tax=Nanorana parkeri TaxID=125878 RepID=UPI000854DB44|nr:PREDICTED: biogenesis of lysosome-related organelles complex 1 subunit 4-like [Nanorana parkeri]
MALAGGAGQWEPEEEVGLAGHWSPGDSGHVSQSQSACSGVSVGLLNDDELAATDYTLKSTANQLSSYLLPDHQNTEIENLEKSLEDLLVRVDEFVGMLDMIRNDTSQVVNEKVPQIYTKAAEMRKLYQKIDLLEAFVKKVGGDVALMDEHVTQAETNLGTFPNPLKRIFQNLSASPLFSPTKATTPPRTQQVRSEPPLVFKTEDFFPTSS